MYTSARSREGLPLSKVASREPEMCCWTTGFGAAPLLVCDGS